MIKLQSRRTHLLEFLILALVVLALYGRTLGYDFVWDDKLLISENPYFNQKLSILDIFRSSLWSLSGSEEKLPFYRPLLTLMYWIEIKIWGPRPFFFHAMNILMHMCSVAFLWMLAVRFQISDWGRRIGCALFVVHPVQVSTISFISCHSDLMVQCLGLFSLLLWTRNTRIRWFAIVFVFAAMLVKEAAVVLPLVLVLYDILTKEGRCRKISTYAPLTLLVFYFFLRNVGLDDSALTAMSMSNLIQNVGAYRMFQYLGRILLPTAGPLHMDIQAIGFLKNLVFVLMILAVVVSIYFMRVERILKFVIVWFFLNLFIISDWTHQHIRFSDQLLYLSMAPLSLLAGFSIPFTKRNGIIVASILAMFASISFLRVPAWKNELEFWNNEMKFAADDPAVVMNYVSSYITENKPQEPCRLYGRAFNLLHEHYNSNVDYQLSYKMGHCLLETNPLEAEKYLQHAVSLSSAQWMVKNTLAASLIMQKKYDQALPVVIATTQEAPKVSMTWQNLGVVYARLGRYEQALTALNQAKQTDPGNPQIDAMMEQVVLLSQQTRKSKVKH